jgi:hypothetical protein
MSNRARSKNEWGFETNESFEHDLKRRIGQHQGVGTPLLMKK